MPKKKEILSNDDRAARINSAAYQAEVDNDPASFERAFAAIERGIRKPKSRKEDKSSAR